MNDMQPGQLIAPQSAEDPKPPVPGAPAPDRPTESPEPVPAPMPAPEPITPATGAAWTQPQPPAPIAVPQPPVPAAVTPVAPAPVSFPAPPEDLSAINPSLMGATEYGFPEQSEADLQDISWTAAEFVEHHKGSLWYLALAGAAVAITVLAYLLSHDLMTTGTIAVVMVGFGLFAARRPRTLTYTLSMYGMQIGPKVYDYQDFKTFSVAEEGQTISIVFMPLKRFMPPLTIYLTPDVEDRVVDFLSAFLPLAPHRSDAIDSLMRRIHF